MASRRGAARVRHIHCPTQWLQQAIARKRLTVVRRAGRDLAARGLPFGNVDAPTDAELANVTLDARRRAQRFLEVHADDVDADVFRRFLAGA